MGSAAWRGFNAGQARPGFDARQGAGMLLPAWSSELETGMSLFFSELPAWSSELETGMSLFFRVARVEFRVEFPSILG